MFTPGPGSLEAAGAAFSRFGVTHICRLGILVDKWSLFFQFCCHMGLVLVCQTGGRGHIEWGPEVPEMHPQHFPSLQGCLALGVSLRVLSAGLLSSCAHQGADIWMTTPAVPRSPQDSPGSLSAETGAFVCCQMSAPPGPT